MVYIIVFNTLLNVQASSSSWGSGYRDILMAGQVKLSVVGSIELESGEVLLGSNNSICIGFSLISAKHLCHSKVRYLGVHIFIQ